jgi:hypothetical protein
MFLRTPDGNLVVRFVPRLMCSLSRNGIPNKIMRVARFVGHFGRFPPPPNVECPSADL